MKLDIQKELFRGLYLDCLHTNPQDSTRLLTRACISLK